MQQAIRFSDWIAAKFLEQGSRIWKLPRRIMWGMYAMPFVVALSGVVGALLGKEAYKWFTEEDGFCEDGQVVFWFLTLCMSVAMARRLWLDGERFIAGLPVGRCFCVFFLMGEEISWGQHIIGWQTPSDYAALNKLAGTNVHNIYDVGRTFKWVYLMVAAYGAVTPLAIWRSAFLRKYRSRLSLVIPHYTLVPYFLLPMVWKVYANLVDPPKSLYFVVEKYSEVMELVLAMAFFLFMVFQLRTRRK